MRYKPSQKNNFLWVGLLLTLMITVQCPLFGPEPGDPVFPAPIDQSDSSAVRAILDLNNLKKIEVRKVINPYTQGRIAMLIFDSLGLDSFSFSADFQKLDSLWSVNLSNNKIVKVNCQDSLTYKKDIGIELERNLLAQFPIDLLKIKGLFSVDVSYNKISTISKGLMTSGFRQIGIDHNKLCSVSDTVKLWLDSLQNNWANFQDCP
jgi:Leucine-rich repeat (LRR) protein